MITTHYSYIVVSFFFFYYKRLIKSHKKLTNVGPFMYKAQLKLAKWPSVSYIRYLVAKVPTQDKEFSSTYVIHVSLMLLRLLKRLFLTT